MMFYYFGYYGFLPPLREGSALISTNSLMFIEIIVSASPAVYTLDVS